MKKVLITLAFSFLFSTPSFGEHWRVDHAGVCRDNQGQYPRWSDYNWTLQQCETNCRNNPNCQGFAMAKNKNYCQLFGSDGAKPASKEGTQITHGDSKQSEYTCFIKAVSTDSCCSGSTWLIDNAGVCRDNQGQYPRWSDYNWTLQQCETNCRNNTNCQGFAMAKNKNYCQLFGSDGAKPASKEGTQITHGDSKQSEYTCFIASSCCIK